MRVRASIYSDAFPSPESDSRKRILFRHRQCSADKPQREEEKGGIKGAAAVYTSTANALRQRQG